MTGEEQMVKFLSKAGASVKARGQCRTNEQGTKTAEGWARQRGHDHIAQILKNKRMENYKVRYFHYSIL